MKKFHLLLCMALLFVVSAVSLGSDVIEKPLEKERIECTSDASFNSDIVVFKSQVNFACESDFNAGYILLLPSFSYNELPGYYNEPLSLKLPDNSSNRQRNIQRSNYKTVGSKNSFNCSMHRSSPYRNILLSNLCKRNC